MKVEKLYTVSKTRPGADCCSDHELLIRKFRLKSKKVGKTNRPFKYDLNQIPYDYTVEARNIPGYWGNREGTYCPPKGYFVADENPDAFEAYDATFPPKEKLHLPGQLV